MTIFFDVTSWKKFLKSIQKNRCIYQLVLKSRISETKTSCGCDVLISIIIFVVIIVNYFLVEKILHYHSHFRQTLFVIWLKNQQVGYVRKFMKTSCVTNFKSKDSIDNIKFFHLFPDCNKDRQWYSSCYYSVDKGSWGFKNITHPNQKATRRKCHAK